MVSDVYHGDIGISKEVRALLGIILAGVILALAVWGLGASNGNAPVVRRTQSVWIPGGAEKLHPTGIPASAMPLQDYKAWSESGAFSRQAVSFMPSQITYVGYREGMAFLTTVCLPPIQGPQGFWYWLSYPDQSLDLGTATITYTYDPHSYAWITIVLIVGGVLAMSVPIVQFLLTGMDSFLVYARRPSRRSVTSPGWSIT